MNEFTKQINEKRIMKTSEALEKNNIRSFYAKNRDELTDIINSLISNDNLITSGGSMTLKECGVIDFLNEKYKGIFLNRSDADNVEEYFRKSFFADTFFTSTNAVTENGELYNVDGNGNRVSAMIFGPKQVIIVVGVNKIVSDMNEAENRVKKLSAPANCIRLNKKTPCTVKGQCCNCNGDDRICCSYVVLRQQRIKDRIKVIFLNEDLGL